ncbi:putative 1-phosphatidylinositol 3-phosphate 5-kinase [Bienertia sinuspersici]
MTSGARKGRLRLRGSSSEIPHESEDDEIEHQPIDSIREEVEQFGEELANHISNSTNEANSESRPMIDPAGLWSITKIIQSFYDKPYTCWSNVAKHAKEYWWNRFQQRYQWDVNHKDLVEQNFGKKAAICLKHLARGGKKGILHSQWSISATEITRRKMKETGKMPTVAQLFLDNHTKKDKTFDNYLSKKASSGSNELTIEADNNSLFEAIGGWTKKGTMFGLGNSALTYYRRPTSSPSTNALLTPLPSIVTQLQQKFESTNGELLQTKQSLSSAMEKIVEFKKKENDNKKLILGLQEAIKEMSQTLGCRDLSSFWSNYDPPPPSCPPSVS